LSSNAISGSIPRSISRLKHMHSLNFNLNREHHDYDTCYASWNVKAVAD
jgi:hypothetical protein